MALKPGQNAPDFTLPSTSGREFVLHEALKDKAGILFFYPKDFTRGCTAEACGFRDSFEEFKDLEIPVFGISRDNLDTHRLFIKKYGLPFELLSDEEGKVCKAYDALIPVLKIPKRITYLIDQNHSIKAVYQGMFKAKEHVHQMVANFKDQ